MPRPRKIEPHVAAMLKTWQPQSRGDITAMAKRLGISRSTLDEYRTGHQAYARRVLREMRE